MREHWSREPDASVLVVGYAQPCAKGAVELAIAPCLSGANIPKANWRLKCVEIPAK